MAIAAAIPLLLLAAAVSAPAEERRCGWLMNPTPANWSLVDRAGEWTLDVQGGAQHEGADMPDMSRAGWVVTNGVSYGYGCACLEGRFLRADHTAPYIRAARAVPLRRCRVDRRLPKPD